MARLTKIEKETIVLFNEGEDKANIYSPLHLKQLSIAGAEINRLRVPPQKDSVA